MKGVILVLVLVGLVGFVPVGFAFAQTSTTSAIDFEALTLIEQLQAQIKAPEELLGKLR